MDWPLQDAQDQLQKVVERAQTEGPQTVTLRGERAAVVLSAEDYDRYRADEPTLVDTLLSLPLWDDELAAEIDRRDTRPSRPDAL